MEIVYSVTTDNCDVTSPLYVYTDSWDTAPSERILTESEQ